MAEKPVLTNKSLKTTTNELKIEATVTGTVPSSWPYSMLVAAWVFGISESSVSCLMSLWFSTHPHTLLEGHPCQASMPAKQYISRNDLFLVMHFVWSNIMEE